MKHTLLTLSIIAALTACGSSDDDKDNEQNLAQVLPKFSVQELVDPTCVPTEVPAEEEGGLPTITECEKQWVELADDVSITAIATKIADPSGQLRIVDANPGESLYYPLSATGKYGEFFFNSAGEWTYTLASIPKLKDGEEYTAEQIAVRDLNKKGLPDLVETFTVTTADGTEKVITILVQGIDEPATFGGDIEKLVRRDTGEGSTKGKTTVKDANPEEAAFLPGQATAPEVKYGVASFDPATGEWTYDLDEMNAEVIALADDTQSLTDSFTIKSLDGTEQVITILIKGSNQVPAIIIAHTSLSENADGSYGGKVNTDQGSFISSFTVVDPNFEEAAFKVLDAQATTYGHITIDSMGLWTYSVDHSKPEVQALFLTEATDTPPTITDTFKLETIDGSYATVVMTIEGTVLVPATFSGLPVVTDNVSSSLVNLDQLETSGALKVTDVNDWQAMFNAASFDATYGTFSIDASGAWTYTLTDATVALINEGKIDLPFTEDIEVSSVDGTKVMVPVSIISLDKVPPNRYLQVSSKNGTSGITNIDNFGKATKGKLTLDVRLSDNLSGASMQLFGASSNNPAVSMVDLQFKPAGAIAIRDNANIDGSVTYTANEWFPLEMTWDSTQSPAQMTVKLDGKLVSDFATATTADVSGGAFRISLRCGKGTDDPATLCDFDNIKVTHTTDGSVIAVSEDFQNVAVAPVNVTVDNALASGGRLRKHSNGYNHRNTEILEESGDE